MVSYLANMVHSQAEISSRLALAAMSLNLRDSRVFVVVSVFPSPPAMNGYQLLNIRGRCRSCPGPRISPNGQVVADP
jgi:hypothetical protein